MLMEGKEGIRNSKLRTGFVIRIKMEKKEIRCRFETAQRFS